MQGTMVKMRIAVVSFGVLLLSWAGSMQADPPETFERGTGKYILVLKDPRTGGEDVAPGKKKAKEPDVAKHGGKILHKKDATRIIKLPVKSAKALRKEENVAYLQRVWLGESREEWGEELQQESSIRAESDSTLETEDTELTWTTGQYLYDGSGNIKQIGGNTYRYDKMGRLTQAVVNGVTETYQYDSFGNLVGKTGNGAAVTMPAVDAASNRLKNETYDAAGNLTTNAGTARYHYDSLSMIDRVTKPPAIQHRMIYGPDDERIGVVVDGVVSRWKIRDFSGKVLREYKADDAGGVWEWTEDYIYGDGQLLAAERENYYGGKRHFHTDHLGSVRMITNQGRQRIAVHDFFPFGQEQTDATQEYNRFAGEAASGDFRAEPMKFTGHERDWHGWLNVDNDDYLDYMHARYYDSGLGRFLSVDPVLNVKAALRSPQMWNRYAYALNNPVRFIDPDGRLVQLAGSKEDQQKLLELIRQNLAEKDRKLVTLGKNGMLQIAGNAKGSTAAFSMLKGAVQNKDQTIGVSFAQTAAVKPGPGPVRPMQVDLQNTGGGLTTKAANTLSGNIEVAVDPRGSPQGESLGIVMGHELIGHGIDLMMKGTSSEHSAINTENLIRLSLGLPLRPNQIIGPWPNDPER